MEEKKNYSVKIISDTPLAIEQLYQIAQVLSKILIRETIVPSDMLDKDNVLKYEFIKEQAEDFKNELEKADIKCSIVEPTNDVKIIPDKPLAIEQLKKELEQHNWLYYVKNLENELGEGSTKYSIVEPTISENKEVEEEKEYQVEIVFSSFLTQISRSRLTDAQREKIAEIIRKVIPHESVDPFKMWDTTKGIRLLDESVNPFKMPDMKIIHRIKYLLTKQQAETLKKELEFLDIISGVSIVMLKEELLEQEGQDKKRQLEKVQEKKEILQVLFLLPILIAVVFFLWRQYIPKQEWLEYSYYEFNKMFSIYSPLTEMQKVTYWNKYYGGRYVRWTGVVSNISQSIGGEFVMQVDHGGSGFTDDVIVTLRNPDKQTLFSLHKGSVVTYSGKLEKDIFLSPTFAYGLTDGRIEKIHEER